MNRISQYQLDRAFFPVEKRTAYDQQGNRITAVVDPVGEKVISKVSDRYTLVDNKTLVQPFVDKFGLPAKLTEYANRKSYIFEFETGRDFDLGGGDIIKERLIVANSYDKTKSFSFFFGAFRMVCTNGLYTAMGAVIAFKKKHIGEIPVGDLVNNALGSYTENKFTFWKRLKEIPLSKDQEIDLINKWTPFEFEKEKESDFSLVEWKNKYIKDRAIRLVSGDETMNNQRNGWGLFNQMNYSIAREYSTPAMVTTRINGDKRSEKYLAESLKV
jgi:hypothetical protein